MVSKAVMIDEEMFSIEYLREDLEEGLGRRKPLRQETLTEIQNQIMWHFGPDATKWPEKDKLVKLLVRHYKGR